MPALYIAYLGIRHTVKHVTLEESEGILFTDITEPAGATGTPGRQPHEPRSCGRGPATWIPTMETGSARPRLTHTGLPEWPGQVSTL